ncbi:MAG: dimethyl sulfoxide reductase anchor subunit [Rhodospirillales bacterium]|nr:dimethyl sulfoxide reductase anchor subunit [Rhodospirillales bacterium]
MHPAISIVLFTGLSGAGYGALVWIGVLNALRQLPESRVFAVIVSALCLALIVAGLLSSTFHLRHPERAWRALSQWRSSWLSREGVMAFITFVPALIFIGGWIASRGETGTLVLFGLAAAVCAVVTMICTAMIYRSLWTVPSWSNHWTVPSFLAIGLAGGALIVCAAVALTTGIVSGFPLGVAFVALLGSAVAKACAWRHADRPGESDLGSALGMAGRVKGGHLLEAPHSSENYLQREMIFRIGRKHAQKLRRIALIAGIVVPATLLVIGALAGGLFGAILVVVAAGASLGGTLIERWLFFAEAKHKVSLYYGAASV